MNQDELRLVNEALERASSCPPEDRAAVIEEACGGDAGLRARVEHMLATRIDTAALSDTLPAGAQPAVAPATDSAAALVGVTLDGRYELRELLGQGGMGAVYRAWQRGLERQVAVKVIRTALLADVDIRERFEREAHAAARLRHPNIVTIHDFGVSPDLGAFIVMELLEGRSLRAELRRGGPMAAPEAVAVMRQICAAVDAAHLAGVLHRDLKTDNIWLEGAPGGARTAKVLDFGLAKLTDEEGAASLTGSGKIMGTPAYMSPEQCRGEAVDERSDVYALGCIAYELVTGAPPFRGKGAWGLVYQHIYEEPRPPSDVVPDVPREVEAAILKALAKSPDRRFATAADFGAAIGGLAHVAGDVRPTLTSAVSQPVLSSAGNLPNSMAPLIGRARLVGAVIEWLSTHRLVTLTGPGGIGKTSAALAVARQALRSFDGVWIVELAALDDPSRVAKEVAQTLGVREQPGRPAETTLVEWLGERRLLLVLDNCEHVVEACAALTAAVLRACPNARVLATSQEPLGVESEVALPVPALSLPEAGAAASAESLESYEATALFVERAALVRPGFAAEGGDAEAVVAICRRLDGIPLAIELAAARVKVLSVGQILERLDDRFRLLTTGKRTAPGRQQTLRAAVDWSHELLTEDERVLYRRLSVFAGGWTLEAAEEIGAPLDADVLDVLCRLVDKSFVLVEDGAIETRYRMLETLRVYAVERLAESSEGPAVRERHTDWFVRLAERAEGELSGPSHGVWLDRLEAEHENLRAVLRRAIEGGGSDETALRVCAALGRFWARRGHVSEGLAWAKAALAAAPEAPTIARARALSSRGLLRYFSADLDGAVSDLDEAADSQRTLGDLRGLAWTLYASATVRDARMEFEAATAVAVECRAAARESGDRHVEAMAMSALGRIALRSGDLDRAAELFAESLAICREVGSTRDASIMLFNLGQVAVDQGDFERAEAFLEESTEIARSLGDKILLAGSRSLSGAVALERGDLAQAQPLLGEALVLFYKLGNRVNVAFMMEELVHAAVMGGDAQRALYLGGAAARLREEIGAKLTDQERATHDGWLARAREALAPDDAERIFSEGREAPLRQVVDSVRGERGRPGR